MPDQSFREIQLSGKQLVFLFMCAVVLTVVVFLLGVSVGRDMRAVSAQAAQMPGAAPPAAEAPAPTETTPAELSYPQALQGGQDPSKIAPPPPAAEEPAAEAPPSPAAERTSHPAKARPEQAAAPPPRPAESAPAPSAAAAASGWVVQVGAFTASGVAASEAAKLRGKGYPAFVFTEPAATPGPRYKVRVGPYPARADADRMLKTLATEGYKPLLKR